MSTPTTPPALLSYRTSHRIVVVKDWADDFKHYTPVCERDGIRVYERSPGRWAHDRSEIRALASVERGERIKW